MCRGSVMLFQQIESVLQVSRILGSTSDFHNRDAGLAATP